MRLVRWMARPKPEPIDPAALVPLAQETIRAAKFPMLATTDGDQPRLRPVSPVGVDGFLIHIANLKVYHKTAEIRANPKVELCYLAPSHDQVRITGVLEIETDRATLDRLWSDNPLLRQYFKSVDDEGLIIYRLEPGRVRFMREWALEYHEVPVGPA